MTRAELQRYCDVSHPPLVAPWSDGDYTYATNGRVLIRVSRLPGVAPRKMPKAMGRKLNTLLKWFDQEPHEWVSVPTVLPLQKEAHDQSVMVKNVPFSARYLGWLSEIPHCELGLNGQHEPARIRFQSGEGLIMPRLW